MSLPVRPRRSVLFVPGANERALEKARTLPADGLILDLEDSVAPERKAAARRAVLSALAAGGYGERECVIRINGPDTPWGDGDLAAVARGGADAVLLSKVESAQAVASAAAALSAAGATDALALWCMIETPRGVLRAEAIAGAHARVRALVMGTSDLAKDLHAAHTAMRLPLMTSLGLCLLAARAHGLAILDGVHLDLDDAAGFKAACRQGAELGFDGKTIIHPTQIESANAAFAPDRGAVDGARRIILAHDEARAAGKGVTVVDGRLVESLHVEEAQRIVAMSEAIALREARGP